MKTLRINTLMLLAGIALVAGCAERRTVYVPTYQPAPGYPGQPAYVYPGQTAYQSQPPSQPLVTQTPASTEQATPATPPPPGASPQSPPQVVSQPTQAVVAQPPPAPQVEFVPVAPGPDYAWTPGYWSWNGRWVWIGGTWVLRPRPYAVWIGPRWVHHGHGYVWVRGHWR